MSNYLDQNTQDQFETFLDPFNELLDGTSCAFVTTSMDGIVGNTCNNVFTYLQVFEVLNIVLGIFMMLLMIFAFFLMQKK